jgi:predicted MFS family arabinose efflux permease
MIRSLSQPNRATLMSESSTASGPSAAACATAAAQPPVARAVLFLLAATAGLSVANIYYNQPLLGEFQRSFPQQARWIGAVPTATQLGYAAGMFFLAPLGDRFERRTLILWQLAGLCLMLAAAALSPNLAALAGASLMIGILSTIAQQAVPFAAELAPVEERGAAVGFVMSGLLMGILLARTVAGLVGQHLGWRTMFGLSVAVMIALGIVIALRLPRRAPASSLAYGRLLHSMWDLVREEPVLRNTSLTGASLFAAFSAFWSVLALLLAQAPFHLGAQAAGLFGIVGAAGALVAPWAGRSADRRGPHAVISFAIVLTALSFVVFALSSHSLSGLVVGVIVLDIGVQAAMISNQSRIFALRPHARSRINTIFMVCYFIGGAIGSALGVWAWHHAGWLGVCGWGLLCTLVAWISHQRRGVAAAQAA